MKLFCGNHPGARAPLGPALRVHRVIIKILAGFEVLWNCVACPLACSMLEQFMY